MLKYSTFCNIKLVKINKLILRYVLRKFKSYLFLCKKVFGQRGRSCLSTFYYLFTGQPLTFYMSKGDGPLVDPRWSYSGAGSPSWNSSIFKWIVIHGIIAWFVVTFQSITAYFVYAHDWWSWLSFCGRPIQDIY